MPININDLIENLAAAAPTIRGAQNQVTGWLYAEAGGNPTNGWNITSAFRDTNSAVVSGTSIYIYTGANATDSEWQNGSSWSEVSGSSSGGIQLTDLSVDSLTASTTSSLTYDNTTGEFDFTPIDITGKQDTLTGTSDVPDLDTALGLKAAKQTLTTSGGTVTGTIDTSAGTFNLNAPGSGGGDAVTTSGLDQFNSVTFTGLADVDVMIYDLSSNDWQNLSLQGHKTVWFGTGTAGDVVQWDGSAWNGGPLAIEALSNVDITSLGSGDILKYDGAQWEPFELNYVTLPGTPTLANIALTGEYDDINNNPLFVGTGSVTITESSAAGQTTYTIDSTSSGSGTVTSVNTIAPVSGDVTLSLTDLSDTLGSYVSGAGLKWNGSQWEATVFLDASSSIHDLGDVGTFANIFNVTGQMLYNDSTSTTANWKPMSLATQPTTGQVLTWDATSVPLWSTTTYGPNLLIEGDGNSVEGSITLNCALNSHGITISSAPHSDGANYDIVLPADAGTSGQLLSKSASGNQWEWIAAPGGAVDSVNGNTGTVVLDGEGIDTTSTSGVTVTAAIDTAVTNAGTAQTDATQALTELDLLNGGTTGQVFVKNNANNLDGAWTTLSSTAPVDSVNTKTGAVVLTGDDIETAADDSLSLHDSVDAAVTFAASASSAASAANSLATTNSNTLNNFSGGTAGQSLIKDTGTDYDVSWADTRDVPTGGTNGQALIAGNSGTYAWQTTALSPQDLTWTPGTSLISISNGNNATLTNADATNAGLMPSADKVRFDAIPAATAGSSGQILSTDGSAYGWTTAAGVSVTEDAVRLTNTVGAAGFYTVGGLPKTTGFTSMLVMDSAAGGVFWLSETSGVYKMTRSFLNSVSGLNAAQQVELDQTKKFMDVYSMSDVEIDVNNSDIKITYVNATAASINMAALPTQDIRFNFSGANSSTTLNFTMNDFKSRSGQVVRYGAAAGAIDSAVAVLGSGATRIVWESNVLPVTGVVQYDADGFTAGVVKPTDIISVAMEAPSAKAYTVVLKMPHSGEVTEINTKLIAGTCDVQVSFGGTDLLASAQSTTSTLATGTTFSAASFEAGDEVIVTVSNLGGSSDEDLTVSMSYNIVY